MMSGMWGVMLIVGWIVLRPEPIWAQVFSPTDEDYAAIQSAFLQEDFDKVTRLAEPLLARPSPETLGTATGVRRMTRMWLWHALSLERLHRPREALRELDRLKLALSAFAGPATDQSVTDSVWPEVLFWEGEISRKAFQMGRARLAYERLLAAFSSSSWRAQAQLGLGLVLFHQQDYDRARQQVHEILAASPTALLAREAILVEALCDVKLRRFTEAQSRFQELLGQPLDPDLRVQVTFYLGEALTGLSRFEEAARTYRQVIQEDPESLWGRLARFGLGWSEFQQRRCRESLEAFHDYTSAMSDVRHPALAQDTQDVRAELLFAQGRCLMEVGEHEQAAARFERLRRDVPQHPLAIDAAMGIADVLERQDRVGQATVLLESMLPVTLTTMQRHHVHVKLGSLYLNAGEATKAAAQFDMVKEAAEPELKQAALNGLADAAAFLGHDEEAMRWYEAAMQVAPTSPAGLYAAYQMGRLELHAGRLHNAVQRFEWLTHQADPALAVDARVALAFAYLSNSQLEEARTELERIRLHGAGSPQHDRAGYYLALIALQEGHLDEAQQLCDEVIRRIPKSEEALEARLLLADITASRFSPREALSLLSDAVAGLPALGGRHRGKLAKKMADLARQSGMSAQAIHWYEIAWEELLPQRGELDYRIASCYEEVGDFVVAVHRYRAISQAPWQIRGQLAAAKLMEREEQWQEAMAIYTLITAQPIPEAKIAQERLALLGQADSEDSPP